MTVASKITYGVIIFFAVTTMVLSLIAVYRCLICFEHRVDDFTKELVTASELGLLLGCLFTIWFIIATGKLPYAMSKNE